MSAIWAFIFKYSNQLQFITLTKTEPEVSEMLSNARVSNSNYCNYLVCNVVSSCSTKTIKTF